MKTKICTKCGKEKILSKFGKHPWCKVCKRIADKEYNDKNKEKIAKQTKKYRDKNKEKISQKAKKYRDKNKEKIRVKKKQDYEDNKEYILTRNKNWLKKNKVKMDKYLKEYRIENKKQIQLKVKEYKIRNKEKINKQSVQKRKDDSNFRILGNLRTRLSKVLKGNSKSKSTIELLGCTIHELRKHLQSQFLKGMNWDNYGKNGWEIDHIKPCASFDLSDPKEQKHCFNYTNLQPLWGEDNRTKADKI